MAGTPRIGVFLAQDRQGRRFTDVLNDTRISFPAIENAGHIIDRQMTQMVRLVDDLLDISRITKGEMQDGR